MTLPRVADPVRDPGHRLTGSVEVVARPGVAVGFGLAGLAFREVTGGREAVAELELILAEARSHDGTSVGIVLVQSDLLAELPEALERRLECQAVPLVVPFPAPTEAEPGAARDFVAELLRRAIGYRVRLT